uniref:C2H2-type domain-containing protein n=1 Tax=Mola mola TaxID=94237 RepID=A0A3Q3W1S2_MOLML
MVINSGLLCLLSGTNHYKSFGGTWRRLVSLRECGQSFRLSGLLIEHMSIHEQKKEKSTEEIKGINDKKKEDKNKKLFCPQCTFGTNCPNTFVQHAKTHEKDKKKLKCDKCSFGTLSENDLRRHNIMQHTVITVSKQIQKDDSEIFSCNVCTYRAFSRTVFKNHLLRRHQLTFEKHEAAYQKEKNAQPSNEQHMPLCKTPVEDAEFTSKISIKNQICSKRACSPTESNEISDLFKNSKIKSFKSQLMESKLDKSINVLLSRQRHGKKTAEQNKESNNSSTSVQDSKSDIDGSDELPEKFTVKDEESALYLNGVARRNFGNSSVPKLSEYHSTMKKSPSKRKMSTPYRNTSDQDSCFILSKPLPSPKKINQEEDVEDDDVSFSDTDSNSNLLGNGIKKEKHNMYTYSRRMSMRGALQASKRLFDKIKTEEKEQSDPEIKEESIESEVFHETFESHQIPLTESLAEDESDVESDRKNCPYCPAVFESGVGLSNHIRGHLHRVGLNYNARHVVSPEQVASQDRRPVFIYWASFKSWSSSEMTSIHSCPLCGDSFDNRTGQSNHIRGHLKKLGKSFATKNKSPLILLRELMRDKKELQRALQILGKRRNHFQYGASSKLPSAVCFTSSPIGIGKDNCIPSDCTEARPLMPMFSLTETESEKEQQDSKLDVKNSLSGTNALIGILKKRKCQEDARLKASSQISRSMLAVSSNSEHSSGSRVASSLPKSISGK